MSSHPQICCRQYIIARHDLKDLKTADVRVGKGEARRFAMENAGDSFETEWAAPGVDDGREGQSPRLIMSLVVGRKGSIR